MNVDQKKCYAAYKKGFNKRVEDWGSDVWKSGFDTAFKEAIEAIRTGKSGEKNQTDTATTPRVVTPQQRVEELIDWGDTDGQDLPLPYPV